MLFNAKTQRLVLKDHQTDYITFGSGTRPLVMIQGLNTRRLKGAALSLAFMYRIFAKDHRVYLFDRRDNMAGGITVREMAANIAAAMDALYISNADIPGASQGGMIAQYLAIDRPDLVRKLVLAVTASRNNDTIKSVVRNRIAMTRQGDMKALVADMAEKMYSDEYVKRYRPFMPLLTILQKPKDINRFIMLAEACLTCNAYDELEKIACPVFVIGGGKDKVIGKNASHEIAEKLGCKLHIYEELGHAAYEEAKDFNQMVYNFLHE